MICIEPRSFLLIENETGIYQKKKQLLIDCENKRVYLITIDLNKWQKWFTLPLIIKGKIFIGITSVKPYL